MMKWAVNLLILVMFFIGAGHLAGYALDFHSTQSAQDYLDHLRHGTAPLDWSFEQPDDLVSGSFEQFPDMAQEHGELTLTSPGVNAFLSFNFRGQVASTLDLSVLEIQVESDRPTRMLLFHRAQPDSAVQATAPIVVNAGMQTLTLPVGDLLWQTLHFEDGNSSPIRREAGGWGSPSSTISNLRIHPATTPGARLTFHRVALRPNAAVPNAEPAILNQSCDVPPEVSGPVWCQVAKGWRWTPAAVFSYQESLRKIHPTSWVLRGSLSTETRLIQDSQHRLLTAIFLTLCGLAVAATQIQTYPRWRSGLELVGWLSLSFIALVSTTLWFSYAAIAVGALLLIATRHKSGHWLGNRRAWLLSTAFTATAAAALGIVVILAGYGGRDVTEQVALYPLWAIFQQMILGLVIVRRLDSLGFSQHITPVIAGCLFGLLHYPNFALMCLTCIAGVYWSWSYQTFRTVLPAAASHAVLALAAFHVLPSELLWSGSVGAAFFN